MRDREKLLAKQKRYRDRHRDELNAKQRARNAAAFKVDKTAPGYAEWRSEIAKARARRNPPKNKHTPERRRLAALIASCRSRARERGLPFALKPSDLVLPTHCPALGIELTPGVSGEACPSIDRVSPALGYVAGNCRVVSVRANRIKSDATLDELCRIVEYYSKSS